MTPGALSSIQIFAAYNIRYAAEDALLYEASERYLTKYTILPTVLILVGIYWKKPTLFVVVFIDSNSLPPLATSYGMCPFLLF